jgi:hypothetical protein
MNKAILTIGFALAQTLAVGAFAQGEVGATKKAPTPSTMTSGEKAEARTERREDAAAANQAGQATKGGLVGGVKPAPSPNATSSTDKAAVRSEAAAANKAASMPKGGLVGPTK